MSAHQDQLSSGLPSLSAIPLDRLRKVLEPAPVGHVENVIGLMVEGYCPGSSVGDLVQISMKQNTHSILAEVVGLRDGKVMLIPLGDIRGVSIGSKIHTIGMSASIRCSSSMLGRVLDAQGSPIDVDKGPLNGPFTLENLYRNPPGPLDRKLLDTPLPVGIRAIDGLLTLGRGQRIGILAGAGVGKSTLLAALTQNTQADIVVIALIGERGREVGEFLHRTLDPEAKKQCVMVVATSDRTSLERMRAAFVATTIAEYFANQGNDVLLMMDSLTRFAMAQRELGLSLGEPPTTRGYTPSVFATLPRLLERSGKFLRGSITGIYTVLVEGDDINDPIGDAATSILDGHIVLSRKLAAKGHFPAIDVLRSVSRVMDVVTEPDHLNAARNYRRLLAQLEEAEELAQIGAYVEGADPHLDQAMHSKARITEFLCQFGHEPTELSTTVASMQETIGPHL